MRDLEHPDTPNLFDSIFKFTFSFSTNSLLEMRIETASTGGPWSAKKHAQMSIYRVRNFKTKFDKILIKRWKYFGNVRFKKSPCSLLLSDWWEECYHPAQTLGHV